MSSFHIHQHWYRRKQLIYRRIPADIRSWLFDTSSLTARLIRLCSGQFRVELLSQQVKRPLLDEMKALNLKQGDRVLVRQVHLYCNNQKVVYARTVIPLKTLTGKQRRYARLGTRPLGAMLFSDKSMTRDELMVSMLTSTSMLYPFTDTEIENVWGRRSVFRVGGKPMLVSEFYLPALLKISGASS